TLAKLKPAFERPWGKVTPGNSSQITDGASWMILASEDAVKEHKLAPKAVIIDSEWAALAPSVMGLGPVYCSTAILKRHNLGLGDIELWELNEAFAAQVLGCLAAWDDAEFCRDALGLDSPAGKIPRDRLNVDGGAIGVGHPVGASGNRIVLHLVNAMKRLGYKRGIATECIGGGQGGAMLIEAIQGATMKTLPAPKPAMAILGKRDLELGPFALGEQLEPGPWANWRLRNDEDGIAWLL